MNYKIFYRTKWILLFVLSIFLSIFIKFEKALAQENRDIPSIATAPKYSDESVLLVLLIVFLMAFLFWFLFYWSDRSERTSYLGTLYKDTITEVEYKRLKAIIQEKWNNKEYFKEVLQDYEGAEWENTTKIPSVPRDLPPELKRDAYIKINYYKDKFGITKEEDLTPPENIPRPLIREYDINVSAEKTNPQYTDEESKLYNNFCDDAQEWASYIDQKARTQYTIDESIARKKAEKRAKKAIAINWSVLKGRGTEFVLEFTTIVVIIFAAVILGILGILDTQQIGTLLAAIAGYVLGRATTRGQNESEEVKKSETVTE